MVNGVEVGRNILIFCFLFHIGTLVIVTTVLLCLVGLEIGGDAGWEGYERVALRLGVHF